MKRPTPTDLIEVSYLHGERCWVSAAALAAVTPDKPKVRRYKANGQPLMHRYEGDRESFWLPLHSANIVERGTPRLARGWKARAIRATEERLNELIPAWANAAE